MGLREQKEGYLKSPLFLPLDSNGSLVAAAYVRTASVLVDADGRIVHGGLVDLFGSGEAPAH